MSCAEAGIKVVLIDINEEGLKRGMDLIKANYARSVSRGSRTQESVDGHLSLMHPSTSCVVAS